MKIIKAEARQSGPGPADYFTGQVTITPIFTAEAPGRVASASVSFAPGARTAWHTHPAGQTLLVTEGQGWVQREGGPIEDIAVGDVVWFPAGERHWHGAAPDQAMTHIALQEIVDGTPVTWLELVSDAEYGGAD
ncbi:(R)-mandelonitrile lyase [Paracoccus aminophilus]|uniref:Cupin 2 conserved barrel domain protein n=1 Tax=Paracoccus aminophilus JCM 7686 TaxID=1367847 RepID=S5YE80_PARAH|nr:cupin domain-containing protein [Paracoccus aminophilus]AGT09793.1 cupin 2 conserved barrel domain protein [Paracoccus aminophilus JCM 7686]